MSAAIPCPWCGRENDMHDGHDPAAMPSAGDMAVCWGCGRASVFVESAFGLSMRRATQEEEAEDPRIRQAQEAILLARQVRGRPRDAIALWRESR